MLVLLRRLGVALLACAALFLALEGLAHLVLGSPVVDDESVVPVEVGCFDPELGWALRPGARATSWRTGRPVEYRINADGWRGDDLPRAKPQGTLRLVLLGDSRAFGFGVEIEQHFSELVEGYFRSLEVVNLGVSGYGVDQELLMLRKKGWSYAPDLVVTYVAHFSSERHMHTERFGKPKPRFVLEGDELVLENVPVPSPAADEPGPARRLHRWLRRHSAAYGLARDGLVRVLAAQEGADGDAPAPADPAVTELAAAIVGRMASEAREHGAGFLLVTQVPELAQAARARGLSVLDPSAALANERFGLPDGFGHLNEAGNGVLAAELARALVENGLLPAQRRR